MSLNTFLSLLEEGPDLLHCFELLLVNHPSLHNGLFLLELSHLVFVLLSLLSDDVPSVHEEDALLDLLKFDLLLLLFTLFLPF